MPGLIPRRAALVKSPVSYLSQALSHTRALFEAARGSIRPCSWPSMPPARSAR